MEELARVSVSDIQENPNAVVEMIADLVGAGVVNDDEPLFLTNDEFAHHVVISRQSTVH